MTVALTAIAIIGCVFGVLVAMAAGFVVWALLIEAHANARMRGFSAHWSTLTEEGRLEEIERRREKRP